MYWERSHKITKRFIKNDDQRNTNLTWGREIGVKNSYQRGAGLSVSREGSVKDSNKRNPNWSINREDSCERNSYLAGRWKINYKIGWSNKINRGGEIDWSYKISGKISSQIGISYKRSVGDKGNWKNSEDCWIGFGINSHWSWNWCGKNNRSQEDCGSSSFHHDGTWNW